MQLLRLYINIDIIYITIWIINYLYYHLNNYLISKIICILCSVS